MGEAIRFKKISRRDLAFFVSILSESHVSTDETTLAEYGRDRSPEVRFRPEVVVFPEKTVEISQILAYCNARRIAVTVRGAGTGLAGGALPVHGGLVISMRRFDKIVEIDGRNLQAVVEPGVITEWLQNEVRERGLFYAPDPASRGSSFIGGNVATGAGGPKAVKYGVVKDWVLNLEVVLASGEVIETGARTLKNSTGYNLTQLMVGSEGTLGVVTKIWLKLLPHPAFSLLMLVPFRSIERASGAVSAIFQAGIVPSGLEFMERSAINRALEYVGSVSFLIEKETAAHLLIEVDGPHPGPLHLDCERIFEVLESFEAGEILFADNDFQKNELWKLRRNVGPAVKNNRIFLEEDLVVPRAELPGLLNFIKETGTKWGFETVSFGHAGDGNVHLKILKNDLSDTFWQEEVPKAVREIFRFVKKLGGTLSGEHGIGWVQKDYLDLVFSETEISIRRAIKKVFDPRGILNPGKIF